MIVKEMEYPGGTRVLVWRLEEEAPQLLELCHQAGIPCEDLTDLPAKRQREKAAERLLLCHALGHPAAIIYTLQGAPYIEGESVNLSITHTQQVVALATDCCHVVGLDAERLDRHQVLRVREKFLNAAEQAFVPVEDLPAHVIAWTAKEAVIKAERNSAIDWTEGICLEPFGMADLPPHEVFLSARCSNHAYTLISRFVDDHIFTLAVPQEP